MFVLQFVRFGALRKFYVFKSYVKFFIVGNSAHVFLSILNKIIK